MIKAIRNIIFGETRDEVDYERDYYFSHELCIGFNEWIRDIYNNQKIK